MGPEIMLEKGYQLPEHPSRNISRLEGELPFFQADSPQGEPRRPTAKAETEVKKPYVFGLASLGEWNYSIIYKKVAQLTA